MSNAPASHQTQPAPQASNAGRNRDHNRRVVLELLRRNGPTGRKVLAGAAGISVQGIGNIIDDLLVDGLILDRGRLRIGRGQPPIQYALNPDGGCFIGIEIAVGQLVFALIDLAGGQVAEGHMALAGDESPDAIIGQIGRVGAKLAAAHPGALMGAGLVMPGPFDSDGLMGPTTLGGWGGVAVADRLAGVLGVPVTLDNDANGAAVAELLFGKAVNVADFCSIYFGAGVGLGVIAGNQPLRGAFGNAGEIGHVVVATGGRACACGQTGCLERYASIHALSESVADGRHTLTTAEIEALLAAGDPRLTDWLDAAASSLSVMIGILENIFDPQTVILGGKLPTSVLEALIARLSLPATIARTRDRALPRVQPGHAGRTAAALGAAALPLFGVIVPRAPDASCID